jgi:hypothetical protein
VYTHKDSANKPENSRKEGESFIGHPLIAVSALGESAPLENTTAVHLLNVVDQNRKRCKPARADEEIHGPVQHASRRRDKPCEAEEERNDCPDEDIDFAREWAGSVGAVQMEEPCRNAQNNLQRVTYQLWSGNNVCVSVKEMLTAAKVNSPKRRMVERRRDMIMMMDTVYF